MVSYEWATSWGRALGICSLLWGASYSYPSPETRPLLLLTGSMVKQARFQSKELPSFFSWW